jgi:type I restriction enzyme S subunit
MNGYLETFEFECPAVILSSIGARCGKCFHVEGRWSSLANTQVILPDPKQANSKFLWFQLNNESRWPRQGLAQPFIRPSDVRSHRVYLPPLAEQQRIASILERTEAIRTKRRAVLAHLDTLTQALFFDRFGDPIQNPHGFAAQTMIDIVDPQRPISYGILMPGPEQTEGVKYVRVVDMKDGGIALPGIRRTTEAISNEFRRSLLKSGDLLMSIRGHVGRLAIVPPELDGANITQDTARLAIRGASPVFVRECLRTPGFQRWLEKHTKGVAVRGINLGDVKQMPIIIPPREAQECFASEVAAVEKLKAAHRASLKQMDALFASLQHRAFRGEL